MHGRTRRNPLLIAVVAAAVAAPAILAAALARRSAPPLPPAPASAEPLGGQEEPPLVVVTIVPGTEPQPQPPEAGFVDPNPAPQPRRQSPALPPAERGPLPRLSRPSVVIRKAARTLTVLDGQREVWSCPCVTGAVPGDKRAEGDCRTPEGEFFLCVKNPVSQYTLSLGLSYPDIDDADRGLAAGVITPAERTAIVEAIRARRQPPWNTALGGAIMIHGGGSDREGTLGCIGVDDRDIRELFAALDVGTKITVLP